MPSRAAAFLAITLVLAPLALARDTGPRVSPSQAGPLSQNPAGCVYTKLPGGWKAMDPLRTTSKSRALIPALPASGDRILEGEVIKGHVTTDDATLDATKWGRGYLHFNIDHNFFVFPDESSEYLLTSPGNWQTGEPGPLGSEKGRIEVEWEKADDLGHTSKVGGIPRWAWPQAGDRVHVEGIWVSDCGHGGPYDARAMLDPSTYNGYRSEIHPPTLVVTYRHAAASEFAFEDARDGSFFAFAENGGEPTRATQADIYVSNFGGAALESLGISHTGTRAISGVRSFTVMAPPRPSPAARLIHQEIAHDVGAALVPDMRIEELATHDGYHVSIDLDRIKSGDDRLVALGTTMEVGWAGAGDVVPRLTDADLHTWEVEVQDVKILEDLTKDVPRRNSCVGFLVASKHAPCQWGMYLYVNDRAARLFSGDRTDDIGETFRTVHTDETIGAFAEGGEEAGVWRVTTMGDQPLRIFARAIVWGDPLNREAGTAEAIWTPSEIRDHISRGGGTLTLFPSLYSSAGEEEVDPGCGLAHRCYAIHYDIREIKHHYDAAIDPNATAIAGGNATYLARSDDPLVAGLQVIGDPQARVTPAGNATWRIELRPPADAEAVQFLTRDGKTRLGGATIPAQPESSALALDVRVDPRDVGDPAEVVARALKGDVSSLTIRTSDRDLPEKTTSAATLSYPFAPHTTITRVCARVVFVDPQPLDDFPNETAELCREFVVDPLTRIGIANDEPTLGDTLRANVTAADAHWTSAKASWTLAKRGPDPVGRVGHAYRVDDVPSHGAGTIDLPPFTPPFPGTWGLSVAFNGTDAPARELDIRVTDASKLEVGMGGRFPMLFADPLILTYPVDAATASGAPADATCSPASGSSFRVTGAPVTVACSMRVGPWWHNASFEIYPTSATPRAGDIIVGYGPRGLAFDAARGKLLVAASGSGALTTVDARSRVAESAALASEPLQDVALTHHGGALVLSPSAILSFEPEGVAARHGASTWPVERLRAPADAAPSSASFAASFQSSVPAPLIASARLPLPGPGGLAVDPVLARAYVSLPYEGALVALDAETLDEVGRVALPSPLAIAARDDGWLFVTNVMNDSVSLVDPIGLVASATTHTGSRPVAVAISGARAFVACPDSLSISVVDARTGAPIANMSTPAPLYRLVADGAGGVYATAWDAGRLLHLDADGKTIEDAPVGDHPAGLVFDASTRTLFVSLQGDADPSAAVRALDVSGGLAAVSTPALPASAPSSVPPSAPAPALGLTAALGVVAFAAWVMRRR